MTDQERPPTGEPQLSAQQGGAKSKVAIGVAAAGAALLAVLAVANGNRETPPPVPTPVGDAVAPDSPTVVPPGPRDRTIDFSRVCQRGSGAAVPTGSESEADAYYAGMAKEIGLQRFDALDGVLTFLGYPLTAKKLQDAPPADLMDPVKIGLTPPPAAGAFVAARFFAPKITDVSRTNTPIANVGWRKLVRILPRAGSPAQQAGVDSAFVLFNFFASVKALNPFENADSANTQVMLITSKSGLSPVYWLDYGKTSAGALLSKKLDAFFDAGHTPDNLGVRSYFVPCACVACHGGLQLDQNVRPPAPRWEADRALLNYLDTDHWLDRVKPAEDFAQLAAPVIFDQGGFDIIRTLNREMRDQNARVQPGSPQHRAAAHWVDLHSSSVDHVADLSARALPPAPGTPAQGTAVQWSGRDPADVGALKLINHYCFRCHGSVEFDVYDKPAFLSLRTLLLARLQPRGKLIDDRATMPPDREMSDADRASLIAYITAH